MANFAVIETGGKQYRVAPGQKVKVEKLAGAAGDTIALDKVLLVSGGEKSKIGTPYVEGAAVTAKVLRQARDQKKLVFRFHSKVRYRKRKGHRQQFTELEIVKI